MAQIFHNNEQYDIKRSIFYGCSNTAGTEVPDHYIMNTTFEQVNKMKMSQTPTQWYSKLFESVGGTSPDKRETYNEICKTYSYAKKVSDLLEVDCLNFSEPGSSNKKFLVNILSHITEDFYKEGDVVFIGATSPYRDYLFDGKGKEINYIMGHRGTLFNLIHLEECLVELNSDYQICLNNMICLRSIKDALATVNIPCIFIETHPYFIDDRYVMHSNVKSFDIDTSSPKELLQLHNIYMDTINRLNFVPLRSIYHYMNGPNCGLGHPNEHSHLLFAQVLYRYLKDPDR
jgi:hypothetical protein